jgi:hypothetical protein
MDTALSFYFILFYFIWFCSIFLSQSQDQAAEMKYDEARRSANTARYLSIASTSSMKHDCTSLSYIKKNSKVFSLISNLFYFFYLIYLFYFIYFILFYFILFYFILFYLILFYFPITVTRNENKLQVYVTSSMKHDCTSLSYIKKNSKVFSLISIFL